MRIAVAYNERTQHNEEQGELIPHEDIDAYCKAVSALGHDVESLEVTGSADHIIDVLDRTSPELVLNLAEGTDGRDREARYALVYESMKLPFTGAGSGLLLLALDKRLTQRIVERAGVRVPRGRIVTPDDRDIPPDYTYPLLVKPNYEGSSKGISQDSVCHTIEHARVQIDRLLQRYPQGVNVEQYIEGRDITVPLLEDWPGKLLEPVEHTFSGEGHNVYDFELKHRKTPGTQVETRCPPKLESDERKSVERAARKVCDVLPVRDLGRIDFRMDDQGRAWFLEINPLPRLAMEASMYTSCRQAGLSYPEMFERIINASVRRHRIDR